MGFASDRKGRLGDAGGRRIKTLTKSPAWLAFDQKRRNITPPLYYIIQLRHGTDHQKPTHFV